MGLSAHPSPAVCVRSGTDLHNVGVWSPGASAPVLVGGVRKLGLECSLAVGHLATGIRAWPLKGLYELYRVHLQRPEQLLADPEGNGRGHCRAGEVHLHL